MPPFPLSRDDPFYHRFRRIIARNYPPLRPQEDSSGDPISDPLYFHHKHIASNLILKAVKTVPSLPESLVHTCDRAVADFVNNGHKFDRSSYTSKGGDVQQDMHFASSVAIAHIGAIGQESVQLATKICIHPHAVEWIKLFTLSSVPHSLISKPFFVEGKVTPVYQDLHASRLVPKTIHDILDSATIQKLNGFPDFLECFGLYSFYALTQSGVSLVKRMASTTEFHWKGTSTTGSSVVSPPPAPPDSTKGLLSVTKRHEQTKKRPVKLESKNKYPSKRSFIRIPGRKGDYKRNYRPLASDYLQRAWASAVAQDATFLVFNCGPYEIIGIRHRETQTLYLSELIDTSHPIATYARIHLGLHISMIQDALDRYESKKQYHDHATATRKRGALHMADDEVSSRKRQKSDAVDFPFKLANNCDTYHVSEVEKVFARRNIVLLRLDYRQFFSPAPSAFVRQGSSCVRGLFNPGFMPDSKRGGRYTSQEYVTITLGAPLSHGAVGVVHKGDIEAVTDTGTHRHSCLVKMVYEPEQREKLKKEFEIYQHLAKNNLFEGILRVHGLFEDLETRAMAMIMEFGGRDLKYRGLDQDEKFNGGSLSIPKDEYNLFARNLSQIHQAGILHNDIRLENLMISNQNEISIIDFDCAEVCEHNWKFKEEMATLEDVLIVEASDSVEESE